MIQIKQDEHCWTVARQSSSEKRYLHNSTGLLEPNVRLAKPNTEAVPQPSAHFHIRSIPTMALFRGGKEVARQSGAIGSADIVRRVRSQVG